MIGREEITTKAEELDVHHANVQRDYVFGWVLAGIFSASDLANHLILKGGNCFRKAYFETARYSPDLDFATASQLSPEYIRAALSRVCAFAEANSGVQFESDRTTVEQKRVADRSKHIHEARLYFKDFFGHESQVIISIRLDISDLDKVFLPVQARNLIHPYSDRPACVAEVKCLKLEEMLASKLKCLLQRRHAADLYDFVNATFVSPTIEINKGEVVSAFLKMTIFGRGPRIVKDLLFNLPFETIGALWNEYVVCPRSSVVEFDQAIGGFKRVVDTLFGSLQPMTGELAFFPAHLRNPIMEAGHTMTLLHIVYKGVPRDVEPYSLKYKVRGDGIGREYLYVYDLTGRTDSGPGIKSLVHHRIESMSNTEKQFQPRFEVELSKAGQFFGRKYFHASSRVWVPKRRSSAAYTVQCTFCGKRFPRKRPSTRLNPHKDKYGNRCLGSIGVLV